MNLFNEPTTRNVIAGIRVNDDLAIDVGKGTIDYLESIFKELESKGVVVDYAAIIDDKEDYTAYSPELEKWALGNSEDPYEVIKNAINDYFISEDIEQEEDWDFFANLSAIPIAYNEVEDWEVPADFQNSTDLLHTIEVFADAIHKKIVKIIDGISYFTINFDDLEQMSEFFYGLTFEDAINLDE